MSTPGMVPSSMDTTKLPSSKTVNFAYLMKRISVEVDPDIKILNIWPIAKPFVSHFLYIHIEETLYIV